MREVAADRGAVAHQRIGDDLRGVEEDGIVGADHLGPFQERLARAPADAQEAAFLAHVFEAGDAADVHQVLASPAAA